MSRDVITDSPEADIRGPNNTEGNHQTDKIPTVKLWYANDSNEGESDSGSDYLTSFCRTNAKLATNRHGRSEKKAEIVRKMPLLQSMSLESNASTASSEFSNLSSGNRKSSIESSPCSESDNEDCTEGHMHIIEDITQIFENLKVTPKGSEETDITNLLTETSKLNLNDELEEAKYHVREERTLSRDWLDNTKSEQRFSNTNRPSDNTNVSEENEDSDSADEHSRSDPEDSDTYLSRGRKNIRVVPYRVSDNRAPVQRREETNEENMIGGLLAHYPMLDRVIDQIIYEKKSQILTTESSESATNIANPLLTSDKTNDVSRTRDPPSLTTQPTYTVDQLQPSASNQLDGFPFQSPESKFYDSTNVWIENSLILPEGQSNDMTYGMENSPQNGSLYPYSPLATNGSGDHSPESLRSDEDISALNSVEQYANLDSFLEINEINESETLKMRGSHVYVESLNYSLENYGTPNSTSQSSPTNNPVTIAGYESQTNYTNVFQLPTNLITDENLCNGLEPPMVNNTYFDTTSNTASPNLDQLSPYLSPSHGTATDRLNQVSSNNLNSDSNIKSHRISGCIDSVGLVTFTGPNKFYEPSIHLTNNGNVEINTLSLKKDFNVVQDQKISTNSNEEDEAWKNKPNPAQPTNFPNGRMQNTITSNTSESNVLIPTTVKERPPIPEKKPGPPCAWRLLKLPASDACEQLKRVLNERDVFNAMRKTLLKPDEEYSQKGGSSSDTPLMKLVREPTTLEKDLRTLAPIVGRTVRIPSAFMARDERGQDALYLAAINCPNRPYVAGYLAITIAELCKNNTVQLNTYNQKRRDTLMHVVAAQGDTHLEVMKQLLYVNKIKGYNLFDLSAKNSAGQTPFEFAKACQTASKPSTQMFRLLMKYGPNPCLREDMVISPARSKATAQGLSYPNVDCGAVNVKI